MVLFDKKDKGSSSLEDLPLVASIRTGLAGKDEAIINTLPDGYQKRTVAEVVRYLLDEGDVCDDQLGLAESVKRELDARGSIIMVNGTPAKLYEPVTKYLSQVEHPLPDGQKRRYLGLEIEVSAVQQGGL